MAEQRAPRTAVRVRDLGHPRRLLFGRQLQSIGEGLVPILDEHLKFLSHGKCPALFRPPIPQKGSKTDLRDKSSRRPRNMRDYANAICCPR